MEHSDNQELKKKFQRKETFFQEMETVSRKFCQFEQQAYYCTLTGINPAMIAKFNGRPEGRKNIFQPAHEDIYLINGLYQPTGDKSFEKLILQIVKTIPRPQRAYALVYSNVQADAGAYNDFKKVLELLPIEFFLNLTRIYVLQASFFGKASSWLSFGTISNYIFNKTVHVETLEELAKEIGIDHRDLAQMVPKEVLQEMRAKEAKDSAERGREKRKTEGTHLELRQMPPPAIQAPGALTRVKSEDPPLPRATITKLPIEAYQLGPTGAPIVLEMLLYFFKNNESYLRLQGLFRKSVSCDDESEILREINNKNYDYLLTVSDPHLIANAIKRFISNLQEPVIPFPLFEQFMALEGSANFPAFVAESIKNLSKQRKMLIFVLFDFLREQVVPMKEFNKMGESNLCIVFGPCLMRSKETSMKDLVYAQKIIVVLSCIYRQFEVIFGGKREQNSLKRKSYREYKRESMKEKLGFTKELEKMREEEEQRERDELGGSTGGDSEKNESAEKEQKGYKGEIGPKGKGQRHEECLTPTFPQQGIIRQTTLFVKQQLELSSDDDDEQNIQKQQVITAVKNLLPTPTQIKPVEPQTVLPPSNPHSEQPISKEQMQKSKMGPQSISIKIEPLQETAKTKSSRTKESNPFSH